MKKYLTVFLMLFSSIAGSEELKKLEWELNPAVSVFITNAPCQASYKEKYPYIAVGIDKQKQKMLKGCFTHQGDNIVIHWDGTADTIEENTKVPAEFFLRPKQYEDSQPSSSSATPEVRI